MGRGKKGIVKVVVLAHDKAIEKALEQLRVEVYQVGREIGITAVGNKQAADNLLKEFERGIMDGKTLKLSERHRD